MSTNPQFSRQAQWQMQTPFASTLTSLWTILLYSRNILLVFIMIATKPTRKGWKDSCQKKEPVFFNRPLSARGHVSRHEACCWYMFLSGSLLSWYKGVHCWDYNVYMWLYNIFDIPRLTEARVTVTSLVTK